MTLQYIVRALQQIALQQKNVRTATDGSVYEFLDNNPSVQYNVFHITQTSHRTEDDFDYYGFNLFWIGRLEDNMENNRLDLQSEGKEVLGNIIKIFCNQYDVDMPTIVYTPFTQKFNDLTAGQYCNLEFEVPVDWLCEDGNIYLDDITTATTGDTKLQFKNVRITSNGTTTVGPDMGYDGLYGVGITVDVPQTGYTEQDLDDAYNEGKNTQKAKLSTLTATTNGIYTRSDGYSAVTVNVEGQTFNTQTLTATTNGTYLPSSGYDGFNQVTVNVPHTAKTQSLQAIENGTYTPDSGYDGFEIVIVDVPTIVSSDTGKIMRYRTRSGSILPTNDILTSYGFDFTTLTPTANTYGDNIGILEYSNDIAFLEGIRDNSDLRMVEIPAYVRSIDTEAFCGCTYLNTVTIPNTVWTVGDGAFKGCVSLTYVNCPGSVVAISSGAFSGCTGLISVTFGTRSQRGSQFGLGSGYLGSYAFADCTHLRMIMCYNKICTPPYDDGTSMYSKGEGPVFTNLPENGELHVRRDAEDYSSWLQYLPAGWTIKYDLSI